VFISDSMSDEVKVERETFEIYGEEREKLKISWRDKVIQIWEDVGSMPDRYRVVVGYKTAMHITYDVGDLGDSPYGSLEDLLLLFERLLDRAVTFLRYRTDLDKLAEVLGLEPKSPFRYSKFSQLHRIYFGLKIAIRLRDEDFYDLHKSVVDWINANR